MADEDKPASRAREWLSQEREDEEVYREKAARLQAILDTTVDGIITINEQRIVQSFNKAAERIFGYSASEAIGNNVDMLMPSPYREEHEMYVENYLRTGERKIIGVGREVVGIRKDGSIFPLYLAVSEAWVGSRRLFSGIVRDITRRKKAEEDLQRAKDELEGRVKERTAQLVASNIRLERINRDLQEFLFIASNDLQEPLRKLQILNDRIRAGYCKPLDEKGKDRFEKMQNEAKRMQDQMQALLGYSRIATKAGPFVMIDLNSVVRGVLRELEMFVKKTDARIEIGDLPAIEADPGQVHLLFQNLVDNALKFRRVEAPVIKIHGQIVRESADEQTIGPRRDHGPKSSGKGAGSEVNSPAFLEGRRGDFSSGFQLSATAFSDEFCRITVEDNGIGFDEKYRDRIFLPYKRLHSRNSPYEGTGMGLTICRKIAEVHGGTVTAMSTPGKGSIFIVILPTRRII